MQDHGGVAAGEAIESDERRWFIDLKVDWSRNGNYDHYLSDLSRYADNIVVDRALSGSAPQEIMLIEGSSAAELSFEVGGEDMANEDLNFVATFSPYSGLSPFYSSDPVGCEVTYRIGVDTSIGIVWYQQFVGNIRTITPDVGANKVTFTALDRVEKLRTPVRFPIWGVSDFMHQRGYLEAQLMDSSWVIDHCLRFGDTSVTPYRPKYNEEWTSTGATSDLGVRFWLTGTGAHTPTIGFLGGDQSQGFPWSEGIGGDMYYQNGVPHPDNPDPGHPPLSLSSLGPDASGWAPSSTNSAAHLVYWGLDRNNDGGRTSHYVGFTMNNTGTNGKWWRTTGNVTTVLQVHIGYHLKIMITVANASIRGEIRNYQTGSGVVTTWRALPDEDHLQIDCKFSLGVGTTANGRFDLMVNEGTTISETIADYGPYMDGNFDGFTSYITVEHKIGLTDVYWSTRAAVGNIVLSPSVAELHARPKAKYAGVLDIGLNKLTHLPVTNADEAWSIITQVAAAEQASVFWDEEGVFRFWNRNTLLDKQDTVVKTINLDRTNSLKVTNSLDSIRNVITGESIRGYARTEVAYESTSADEFYVPGNTRMQYIVYVDNIQSVGSQKIPRYRSDAVGGTLPIWDNDGSYEGYAVQWFQSGAWTEDAGKVSGLDVWAYGNEDGSTTVEIYNGYAEDARLATGVPGGSSSAALRLLGSVVHTNETVVQTVLDGPSVAKYGRRNLPVTGEWVQYNPDIQPNLITQLLPRTVQPIPTTDAVVIAGDPRLQLGDRINVVNPEGLGESIGLQIYGINRAYTRDAGLVDSLSVEMIAPPRIGIWDSAQYGLWDETFFWSA